MNRIISSTRSKGATPLHLLTTSACEFFKREGYNSIDRSETPPSIQSTREFQHLCPQSTVCMVRDISGNVQFFSGDNLSLREVLPGVKMWGVSLEKTVLAYFEIGPHCNFEIHSHISEQITMVLEGELFFEYDDRIESVRSGEVIAIPSQVPHAVFSKEKSVKAIDAWSPIIEDYHQKDGEQNEKSVGL